MNTPQHNRPGTVGKALPNVLVRMENYETGEPCSVNQIGKILVKGDTVMSAYFDDFEATALHMRHGWYDTGDMGYRDEDGYLWHVGRLGRFLKIGGEMVSLVQVEDVLQRTLPEHVEVRSRGGAPTPCAAHGSSWPSPNRSTSGATMNRGDEPSSHVWRCRSSLPCCRSFPRCRAGRSTTACSPRWFVTWCSKLVPVVRVADTSRSAIDAPPPLCRPTGGGI